MPRKPPKPDPLLARIDALREAGVTIDRIAKIAGVARPHLARWIADRRVKPQRERTSIAERVALALPELEDAVP